MRVLLLHETGSSDTALRMSKKGIVRSVTTQGDVLIATYAGLRNHAAMLLRHRWNYVILDEGHQIRNPEAAITLVRGHRTGA
jgi:DNA excision repair protein ERCC-6